MKMAKRQVTRRAILAGASAVGLTTWWPNLAGASEPKPFPIDDLHIGIGDHVRRIKDSRSLAITVLFPKGSLANVQPVGDQFKKLTGVDVRYLEAPLDDINSKVLLSKLTGKFEFDIALPATFGIPDLAQAGAIKDLDTYAKQYEPPEFQKTSLYSIGDYYKGKLYGYQTDGDAYIMFYNKSLLENPDEQKRFADTHGRSLAVPSTWQELDETIAYFHRPEQDLYGGSLFRTAGYLPWEWWIRFHSKGYFPLDDAMTPQINNDAGILALEELIAVSAYLDPKTKTDGLFENWAAFGNGNSFCDIGWGGSQKYFNGPKSKVRGKLAYGPTPGGIVDGKLIQTPYFNWGWNYVVSTNSAEPEIAYLFTLFACSPVISAESVGQDGYFDPFRATHYEDPKIIETYSSAFLETHRHSMANAIPDLYLDGQGEYFGVLRENLYAAFTGKLKPKDALDRTARQWRLITFRLGKESQLEQWAFLKSRYPGNLPNVLK